MKYHYLYKISHPQGYEYVGMSSCTCHPTKHTRYLGRGRELARFKKMIGTKDLVKRVLVISDNRQYIKDLERDYVTTEYLKNPFVLNKLIGGGTQYDGTGIKLSKEHKKKISTSLQGHKVSTNTRSKISAAGKGRVCTHKTRVKISNSHQGRVFTNEHKKNISKGRLSMSDTAKQIQSAKMSASSKGRIMSNETRHKISESKRGTKLKTFSKGHREKLSKLHKNKVSCLFLLTFPASIKTISCDDFTFLKNVRLAFCSSSLTAKFFRQLPKNKQEGFASILRVESLVSYASILAQSKHSS